MCAATEMKMYPSWNESRVENAISTDTTHSGHLVLYSRHWCNNPSPSYFNGEEVKVLTPFCVCMWSYSLWIWKSSVCFVNWKSFPLSRNFLREWEREKERKTVSYLWCSKSLETFALNIENTNSIQYLSSSNNTTTPLWQLPLLVRTVCHDNVSWETAPFSNFLIFIPLLHVNVWTKKKSNYSTWWRNHTAIS